MILLIKNMTTLLFIAFLMIVALFVPTSALLNNPIFYNDEVQFFHFDKTNIFRSDGFYLSNIFQQTAIVARAEVETSTLYDLYLSFDNQDFTNNYTTIKKNYEKNLLQKQKGEFSAKFVSKENSIILFPSSDSILKNNDTGIQNFTVTFDLYPYRTGEGTQYIVSYEGYYTNSISEIQKFGFNITIESGIIKYSFNNFFVDREGSSYSFILQEKEPLINTKWEQHTVVVDVAKSMIKIYRNNVEQDMVFVRQNRMFDGSRLYPSPQFTQIENIPLTIGRNGLFSLDDFVIYRDVVTNFMEHTPNKKLFFETEVFSISKNISSLHEMSVDVSLTNEYYRLAYRISDSYFLPDTKNIPWVYINPSKKQFPGSQSQGKFIQWRVEYFTPIELSDQLFYIKDIFARFKETSDPGTIQVNSVLAKDGAIEISWRTLPNNLIASYEIYYGDRPNYYFGKAEISPESPVVIDVERSAISQNIEYILDGLDNEIPYYISIRAKDIYGQYGSFSPEIMSRPSSVNTDFGYSIGR
ncbi:MAG: hypothetical protein ACRC0X_07075 [Brevinema sp.]